MHLDADDRQVLATVLIWTTGLAVAVPGMGLVLGLAVRVFRAAAGW